MEAENDEGSKRVHDNNTFSLHSILLIVQVSAALAVAGYFGFEGFILWFDWFRLVLRNIFFIFIILNALIGSIYFTYRIATEKKTPSLHEEYITPVPSSVVRSSSPEPSSFAPMEVGDYHGGGGYCNNWSCFQESVHPFQAVVEESRSCYERVVMETSSKSCKKTMMMSSEKKMKKKKTRSSSSTVEYHQRTESERRVMKTASCRSWQAMMDELSSEEFRMTIETFITEKDMFGWRNGVVSHVQNGVADDRLQNGVPQLQNGGVQHWQQNGFRQLQNGGVHHWQQNGFPQLQGLADYDGTGSHGQYLAISN